MVRRRARQGAAQDGRARDGGAVAVEAALITPIVMLLVFGAIEFGMALKDWLGVVSAVRGGARIASAEPRQASAFDDAAAQVARELGSVDAAAIGPLVIYRANASGMPASGTFTTCTTACARYTWNATSQSFVRSATSPGTWNPLTQNACVGEADAVGVHLTVDRAGITGLFFSTLTIADESVMQLEPYPSSQGACK